MRRALVVGIDHYDKISSLTGCVNDAHAVKAMLDRNADGSINFGVKLIAGIGPADVVTRKELKEAITQLFEGNGEVALLYFAGHGHLEATGGYLCAGDCETGDDGVPLSDVMLLANKSKIQNRVIVLDSCHGGIAGNHPSFPTVAEIEDGVTILTASTAEQYAMEENGGGVFTSLFVDVLGGEAANLVGDVTPGAVYAHVDQSLGPWVAQRPVFKTNVKRFVSLRKVEAPLPLAELRRIAEFFPDPGHAYQLDPTYEPLRSGNEPEGTPVPDPQHNVVFAILQNYRGVGLVVPEGVTHMWEAAMQSKTVRLTALGEHYRRLVSKNMI